MVKRIGIITSAVLIGSASLMWGAGAALAKKAKAVSADDFAFTHVSCTGDANEIRVIVTGVKRPQGLITADLFPNKEESFLLYWEINRR